MKKIYFIIILMVILVLPFILIKPSKMINLENKTLEEVQKYADDLKLNLTINEQSSEVEKGRVINQSIKNDSKIKKGDNLTVTISKGLDYSLLKVNELGNIPIMMYHGIVDTIDNVYTGGNVDKDGYQRTKKSFIEDLEFYYSSGYRMIRLIDYVSDNIDVKASYSPIVLTFDDGLSNNIKVTGLDDNGNIIIDPNSAVGILESFKTKYPDYNVTATFFLNAGLFNQQQYNEKILNWLIDNGYDIGNHSYNHADFTKIDSDKSKEEIGKIYNLFDKYIPNKYINIVALPFGSPYKKSHENFNHIINSSFNGKDYETVSTLQVGWDSELSPFNKNFDKTFLKRIRAYDNSGKDFDIQYCFKQLEKTKYISDGNKNTIVVPKEKENLIKTTNLKVISY